MVVCCGGGKCDGSGSGCSSVIGGDRGGDCGVGGGDRSNSSSVVVVMVI